jgi:hypothetical protein
MSQAEMFGYTRLMVAAFGLGAGWSSSTPARLPEPGPIPTPLLVRRPHNAHEDLPLYLRSIDSPGEELPSSFLEGRQRVLAHYGVDNLEPTTRSHAGVARGALVDGAPRSGSRRRCRPSSRSSTAVLSTSSRNHPPAVYVLSVHRVRPVAHRRSERRDGRDCRVGRCPCCSRDRGVWPARRAGLTTSRGVCDIGHIREHGQDATRALGGSQSADILSASDARASLRPRRRQVSRPPSRAASDLP